MPIATAPHGTRQLSSFRFSKWITFGLLLTGLFVMARLIYPHLTHTFRSYSFTLTTSVDTHQNLPLVHAHLRREVEETITTTDIPITFSTQDNSGYSSLITIPQPIFFPQVAGNFQLALKSNQSIIVIIGGDRNIYLSHQTLSGINPSTFLIVDLGLSNRTYVALIQDAQNQRYLHSYNDIQEKGYSRIRTNFDSYLPCNANLMFWTFVRGYMQFFRGGEWFYDTAGCLDSSTGLVKLWLVNGQQGLSALQAEQGQCGLAPLVGINYS